MQTTSSDRKSQSRWTFVLLSFSFFASLFFITFSTLSPFKFNFSSPVNSFELAAEISAVNVSDFFRNIVLFIPFSLTASCFISGTSRYKKNLFWILAAASFCLSLSIELLQLYLPQRTPTLIDLVANSIGGYVGCLIFRRWGSNLLTLVRYAALYIHLFLSKTRNIGFLSIAYFVFLLSLGFYLSSSSSLSNWDPTFPLVIGNEKTGDRPWNGQIEELYILNKDMTIEEVTQFLNEENNLSDALLMALNFRNSIQYSQAIPQLPPLKWSDGNHPDVQSTGILVNADHWLSTEKPVSLLNRQIKATSELSIITKVTTLDLTQKGPARIISISGTPNLRNITLGQEGDGLMVRLRTPFTRENGSRPSIIFPDVFNDINSHYLAFTYSKSVAHLYVDNFLIQTVIFNPAAKLFWSLNEIPFLPKFTPNFIYPASIFLQYLNIFLYFFISIPIVFFIYCFWRVKH